MKFWLKCYVRPRLIKSFQFCIHLLLSNLPKNVRLNCGFDALAPNKLLLLQILTKYLLLCSQSDHMMLLSFYYHQIMMVWKSSNASANITKFTTHKYNKILTMFNKTVRHPYWFENLCKHLIVFLEKFHLDFNNKISYIFLLL